MFSLLMGVQMSHVPRRAAAEPPALCLGRAKRAGSSMSTRTGAGLVAALVFVAVLCIKPADAGDDNSWMKFPGSAYASQADPADRAFIKEWEATPPKGYPTLSPANVAATKAAIKRYGD